MHTQDIVIQKTTFIAPAPYAAGHVLTAPEAEALNQTLAENLRNNFAARMKRAAEDGEQLTQHDFEKYAHAYSFGARVTTTTTRVVRDPIATEERNLAKDAIRQAIRDKGLKVKDVPAETFEAYVNRAVSEGRYRKQAEAIVAARSVKVDLVDLDLDLDLEESDSDD